MLFWLCFDLVLANVGAVFDDVEEIYDNVEDRIYDLPLENESSPSNSVDLEEGSVSIPKSEPTPVPIAPANEELGELKLKIMHIVHTYNEVF